MKLLGDNRPHDNAIAQMRERGGQWAAYQNADMGHPELGHLQFLKYGEGCTFTVPPERYPDTKDCLGWRYLFVGKVDLEKGIVCTP